MTAITKGKLGIIYSLAAMVGFSQSLLIYVAASFFKQQSGQEDVGGFYFVAYLIVLVLLVNLHKFVRVWGKSHILRLAITGEIMSLSLMLVGYSPWIGIVALIMFLIFDSLMNVSMDVVLESYSRDNSSGRIRGIYLTILNVGFIFGPKLSSWILENYGFAMIIIMVLILKSLILLFVFSGLGHIVNGHPDIRSTVKELLAKAWHRGSIKKIYYISCALEFFYGLMIIYSSLYLKDLGLSWGQIGTILMIMLIPFVFFEYPIGWLADKKWGEKEMLIFFLIWQGIFTGLLYFITVPSVWIWSLGMLATRVGAASVAILRDSYFYKRIDGDDVDLIDLFRTAAPIGYIMAAAASAILLNWVGLRELFLVNALVVLSAVVPAIRLKDNLSEAEQKTQS
ncbi:MFS transporter [Candidatus Falkowbacteria bacterium]|nr:MFS transporter [Candidatus Falkowbacteria bacterium]